MQTVRQFTFNHAAEAQRDKGQRKTNVRGSTLRAIHATWKKVVRGIDINDAAELRSSRIAFANSVLRLDPPIESFKDKRLTPARLGAIIDAMRKLERGPALPGVGAALVAARDRGEEERAGTSPAPTGDIVHLATAAQFEAIDKLLKYVRWSPDYAEKFIAKRFKGRKSARLLSPKDANALTNILLNIAAQNRIKKTYQQLNVAIPKISRQRIHEEIPALKRELDIDQSAARARRVDRGSSPTVREGVDDAEEEYDRMVKGAAFEHGE